MSYYGPDGGLLTNSGVGTALAQPEAPKSSVYYKVYSIGSLVSTPVLAYHGYKRNKSIFWAFVWALLGPMVWPVTVPVAFAQGYAKPKTRKNARRRRRRTSRRRR